MRIGKLHFSPGLWPTLAAILVTALFMRLGFWQLDRADQKAALLEDIRQAQQASPLRSLEEQNIEEGLLWRRALLEGHYLEKPLFLLDNRVWRGQAGYFVYSPFRLENGLTILVNRGWIKAMPRREQLPPVTTPRTRQTLGGTIRKPPLTGKLLASNTDEVFKDGTIRLQHIDIKDMNSNYSTELLPLVFRLDQATGSAYRLDWPAPASGREKHLGYAFQWFAMATAVLVIFLLLSTRQEGRHD